MCGLLRLPRRRFWDVRWDVRWCRQRSAPRQLQSRKATKRPHFSSIPGIPNICTDGCEVYADAGCQFVDVCTVQLPTTAASARARGGHREGRVVRKGSSRMHRLFLRFTQNGRATGTPAMLLA